jgi:hypothetical protein
VHQKKSPADRIRPALRWAAAPVAGVVVLALLAFVLPGGLPLPSPEKRWCIAIWRGPSPLDLAPPAGDGGPVLTPEQVGPEVAAVADPFLLRDGARWLLFFESQDTATHRGSICLAESEDFAAWRPAGTVISEPFHLSYPYVFEADGEHFLVPESGGIQELRLYRAAPFPSRFVFVATLLEGARFTDTCVFRHAGRWWLLTFLPERGELDLYHAERLTGPWQRHPASPVARGEDANPRPGGRVVLWNGRLLRFAQQDRPRYGTRVLAREITELTPTSFAERPAGQGPVVAASGHGWNALGMHQVDPVEVAPGQWVAAVDGYRTAWMLGFRRLSLGRSEAP